MRPGGSGKTTAAPTRLRQILDTERSVAEWSILGLWLAGPYLFVGLLWAVTHVSSFRGLHGVDLVVPALGSLVFWPALLIANVCVS